jgi:hypothetical protein
MKSIGIMIRRRKRTNKKILDKEIITLHSKLKKNDTIITHFTTEKDYTKGNYHTHLIIEHNDEYNLLNQLNNFIGGNTWEIDKSGLDEVKINNGKWGEIHTHQIWDKDGFKGYMNKHELVKTLF